MENLTFSFNTVIGLLGLVVTLCVFIYNRSVSDIKQLESWQRVQDERLKEIEKTGSVKMKEFEMCIEYIKKEIEKLKRKRDAKN